MDRARSPYSPGAGVPPVVISGRDAERDLWRSSLVRLESGRAARGLVLHGVRGVGKTVLLGAMREEAERRDWVVASLEVGAYTGGFLAHLSEALYPALRRVVKPGLGARLKRALATFAALNVSLDASGTWSFGLDLDPAPPPTGKLELDLLTLVQDLADGMQERGTGLAVFIDEMQDLDQEALAALCAAAHQTAQRNAPFLLCAAGLPSLPRVLSEAKSYAERLFEYRALGPLPPADAARALQEPARAERVEWQPQALEWVLAAANGYPFFLQELGQSTWEVASGPREITLADAREGVAEGRRRLDVGFFLSRWERATPAERAYLEAMTASRGPCTTKEVAERLGRSVSSLGPIRAGLIGKGLIYSPEHGYVDFTVPGMADFVTRIREAE
jgi:hypothetical protein